MHMSENTATLRPWRVMKGDAHGPLARRRWERVETNDTTVGLDALRATAILEDGVLTAEACETARAMKLELVAR